MISLRTNIPYLICILMDRGISFAFNGGEHPMISYSGPNGSGDIYFQEKGEAYGARAIEMEKELTFIFADSAQ